MGVQNSQPYKFGKNNNSSLALVLSRASSRASMKRRQSSNEEDDPWGWFEDFGDERSTITRQGDGELADLPRQPIQRAVTLPPPASAPPPYVLESSLSSQRLWYETAGRRPKQPQQEREFFEQLWELNFKNSYAHYNSYHGKDGAETIRVASLENVEVMYRGKGSFSNAVSKSFLDSNIPSVTIQIPKFRVRRSASAELFAEYLVVVSLGNVTFGVWRRHSDFKQLANQVQFVNDASDGKFKNTVLSWQCLIHRQRWFRCLDKEYLSLKCFLLERFMHDLLFESNSPDMISDFLGLH